MYSFFVFFISRFVIGCGFCNSFKCGYFFVFGGFFRDDFVEWLVDSCLIVLVSENYISLVG